MKLRSGIVIGLLVLVGCDSGIDFCTNRDPSGLCPDAPDYNFDAGTSDAGVVTLPDGAILVPDASVIVGMDSSVDAAVDAGPIPPATLTLDQFCEGRFASAIAWRNAFEACCVSQSDRDIGADLLASNFSYSQANDTVGTCVSGIQSLPAANLTYVGTAASACATKLAAQFTPPPASCPAAGFDEQSIEATIGHQALPPVQFAECRAALVGNVAFNASCSNPLECKAPYRCVDMGGSKTCRDPLVSSSACTSSSECADGLLCVTSAGSATNKVCRPASQPIDVTVACTTSVECGVNTLCGTGDKCAAPVAQIFCKP